MISRHPLFSSLTRISDLASVPFEIAAIDQADWDTGDYVVAEVTSLANANCPVELPSGRMTEVSYGDFLVGAFGVRAATLEAVGSWRAIEGDGAMQALTGAGLLGRVTSISPYVGSVLQLAYRGHVVRAGNKVRMSDFVGASQPLSFTVPTVLIIGTSMSSGKTTAGKVIVRQLSRRGHRVAGVKLTGAGRYRDILSMRDAGADVVFDFVDAGLPSTVCPPDRYRSAMIQVLNQVTNSGVEVVVIEAGASPLEPYNGDLLVKAIRDQIRLTVLCASDPYAAVGVTQGFGFQPDVIAGIATSTSAGVEVVEKLSGIDALNLLDPASHDELAGLLETKLSL